MRPLAVFLVLVLSFTSSLASSFQEIGWRDLTYPIEPADDPFFGLTFEQRQSVETLFEFDRKKARGESLSEAENTAVNAATLALRNEGISAEEILEKNTLFLKKLKLQRNSVRSEWGNQQVRIPGYILPLEFDETEVVEFFLVPYVGACIHVPPPPPNQIILVAITSGYKSKGVFEPVWVEGTIEINASKRNLYLKDGSADIEFGYRIQADSVEAYSKRP